VTLHIAQFEGGNALSAFRVQQLLPRLRPFMTGSTAFLRFVHLVASEAEPSTAARDRLAALLT
jgi:phosphoribosylformylglycinamidine synthase